MKIQRESNAYLKLIHELRSGADRLWLVGEFENEATYAIDLSSTPIPQINKTNSTCKRVQASETGHTLTGGERHQMHSSEPPNIVVACGQRLERKAPSCQFEEATILVR
jgi:hypothetical protein